MENTIQKLQDLTGRISHFETNEYYSVEQKEKAKRVLQSELTDALSSLALLDGHPERVSLVDTAKRALLDVHG